MKLNVYRKTWFSGVCGILGGRCRGQWPRHILTPEAEIVIYQPQLESFTGNKLTGRAAVSVTPKGRDEPFFGALWIAARVSTDRDLRIVTLLDIDIQAVKFPPPDSLPTASPGESIKVIWIKMNISQSSPKPGKP